MKQIIFSAAAANAAAAAYATAAEKPIPIEFNLHKINNGMHVSSCSQCG